MQRYLRHRETDLDALGRRQHGSRKSHRVHIGAIAIEMMFGEPEHFHPKLIT